ncbi:MAG: 2Fe-2S iron-sulfur cluster-binding protein [Myxococcota bacterium]
MQRLSGTPLGKLVSIDLEGESIAAVEGEPVACSLLAAGETVFSRSVKYHRPRGPFCFTGACSHCLMRVDGVPNVFTCRVPARAGMRLERQNAFPSAKLDVFAATDWLFPHGLDHHELFAGVPIAEKVMLEVARHLAGLGLLPDKAPPQRQPMLSLRTKIAIVGAGAAGLAAAEVLAARKVPFLLLEREDYLGGRLAHGAPLPSDPAIPAPSAMPEGAVHLGTTAIGLYEDAEGRFLAAVENERLVRVDADRFLLTTGGHPQLFPFENNDLPGVFSARAVCALLRLHRIKPGKVSVLVGGGEALDAVASLLAVSGIRIAAVIDPQGRSSHPAALQATAVKAHGRQQVRGLTVRLGNGLLQRVACDLLVVCQNPAPSFELARHAGAQVEFREGVFAVQADELGRTTQRLVFAAGEITGPMNAQAAHEKGRRAALALAEELS